MQLGPGQRQRRRDRPQDLQRPERFLAFLGTLFLFDAAALATIVPGYEPPTGSLSTAIALALCVFVAVPLFGIREQGVGGYLKSYLEPTLIMLPFKIISEVSRTLALALAVRLFEVPDHGATTMRSLIREYLISLLRACAESLASENASRLAAMERADRNIQELLEQVHGSFQRRRQGAIDEELFDVTSGYGALAKA